MRVSALRPSDIEMYMFTPHRLSGRIPGSRLCRQTRSGIWCPPRAIRSEAKPPREKERGQAIAELAVILPVLMTLMMGVFWAGLAYSTYETITRAAREGARAATAPSCALCGNAFYSASDVQSNFINPALAAGHLDPSRVRNFTFQQGVVLNPNANGNPTEVGTVVSFTYPFQFPLPFTSVNLTQINIWTRVQMREEH